ncbi:hypothetical protein OHA99_09250 [Streptomyces coelicoflavus]|uniref:hypothetical protein n=1 Tax=Streptomyces coelicoflavus TaxID=285562 RepID=UPI003249A1D1
MFVRRSKHADLQARNERLAHLLSEAHEELAAWKSSATRAAALYDDATTVAAEDAGQLKERLARALRACARYRTDNTRLQRRERTLQQRLDDAVGLTSPAVDEGTHWQARRTDKPLNWARTGGAR